jgi:uncharacterized protein YggT (Ycf19 family)
MLNKGNSSVVYLLIYVNTFNNQQQKPCFAVIISLISPIIRGFHRLKMITPIGQ